MNLKLSFSKLFSVLLVSVFFIGFQSSAEAQLTIENATECTIWVAGAQMNTNTPTPCDACTAGPLTRLIPGNSLTIPYNATCGLEYWKEVFYTLAPSGAHVATTANPSLICGPDFGMLNCGGAIISTNWSQTGAGSGVVTLK